MRPSDGIHAVLRDSLTRRAGLEVAGTSLAGFFAEIFELTGLIQPVRQDNGGLLRRALGQLAGLFNKKLHLRAGGGLLRCGFLSFRKEELFCELELMNFR